jgi:hypothetical protein
MRNDEAAKTSLWRSQGIKRKYVPLNDFNFEEYANKQTE